MTSTSGLDRDAESFELLQVVADAQVGIVRHERDAQPRRAETRERVGRAGNRLVTAPEDAVEITAHDGRAVAPRCAHRSAVGRLGAAERVAVLVTLRSHRDRKLEVTARAEPVALAQARQAKTEVGVIVDRIELERALELAAGRDETPAPEVRTSQGLADRALLRLERTRPLEGDDCRVRARAGEEAAALLKGFERFVRAHEITTILGEVSDRRHCCSSVSRVARQSGNLRKGNADVADFLPFRGIRYDPELLAGARPATLDAVAAPPYDVIDDEERAALEARDPHNSVRLILPHDEGAIDRYQVATATLTAWNRLGILRADLAPQLYGYEMRFHDDAGQPRRTRGVLGALALPPAGDAGSANAILPHERTLPKAKSDRLELLRATRANTDPIWGLSLTDGLTQLLDPLGDAAAACVDDEGVEHELFPIHEPDRIEAIRAAVARTSVVLADGHHRFETACTYRDERLAAGLDDDGAAAIMTLVVELVDHELSVRAIHRLLDGIASVDLRIALATRSK